MNDSSHLFGMTYIHLLEGQSRAKWAKLLIGLTLVLGTLEQPLSNSRRSLHYLDQKEKITLTALQYRYSIPTMKR